MKIKQYFVFEMKGRRFFVSFYFNTALPLGFSYIDSTLDGKCVFLETECIELFLIMIADGHFGDLCHRSNRTLGFFLTTEE